MRKTAITILLMLFATVSAWAEAVGTWKVYRSYSKIEDIQPAGKNVFVKAYGNIYSYNISDNSITTYSKEDGLGAQNAKLTAWCSQAKKLIIVYEDYVIDLLDADGDVQTNVWLKEKRMTTDKTVHNIYVSGKQAYLCTAFGLIDLNTDDATINNTYNIGLDIDSMSIFNGKIYAKTVGGTVYKADATTNLHDKANWTETTAAWSDVNNNRATCSNEYGLIVYDATNKCYWGSNADGKLTQYAKDGDDFVAKSSGIIPDGPKYPEHVVLKMYNNKIHSLRGLYNMDSNSKSEGYVQTFDGNTWGLFDNTLAQQGGFSPLNFMTMDIDPKNNRRIMVGGSDALYEYIDGRMTSRYTGNGTTLVNDDEAIIISVKFDKNGNLWIFNRWNQDVVCLTSGGEWQSYHEEQLVKNDGAINRFVSSFFDTRGMMWFCNNHYNGNFFGFYDTQSNTARLITEIINQDEKNINPPRTYDSRVITEDMEGNIWYATNNYTVYLKPADVKYMMANSDVSAIRVTQHKVARNDGSGLADYLLDGIAVRDIKVDNANRKWVATDDNGVYLISSDNNTELAHFTTENSLLPTNDIRSICIDDKNGRVYFGTLNGLCSYETGMNEDYGTLSESNVYAYPNPVSPDYTGPITIKGLVENAQLKITTSSGYVVHEGVSNGPTYQWDGCDQNGDRVASGVYMVLLSTETGEKGCVTKIAMVK